MIPCWHLTSSSGTPLLPSSPSPGIHWGTPGAITGTPARPSQTKQSLVSSPEEQEYVLVENELCTDQWPQQVAINNVAQNGNCTVL